MSTPFITRVRLRHYRSVKQCDVALGPMTFIVGPNGSGKSNFLDSLRLLADSLRTSLDHALRERSGIQEVRRRSSGHPTHMGVRVDFSLKGQAGHFAFEVGAKKGGGFVLKAEECVVGTHSYRVQEGQIVKAAAPVAPPASEDRMYLVSAAGLPEFRPIFDALSNMGFYNLNPDSIRALQPPDAGLVLKRDGSNLASVFERLEPKVRERICAYLARVVPGIERVETLRASHMETLEFRQRVAGAKDPWRFPAINMSDGTLRALGILTAAFQNQAQLRVPFVGIEEPEVALHPAAAGLLRDCLREASESTQIVVTSHSPELLDDPRISEAELIAVSIEEGATELGPIDEAARLALKDKLFTAGELLRVEQLSPDIGQIRKNSGAQLDLFEVQG
jgi:predicted ATPase